MTEQVNEAVSDRLCDIAREIYSAWEHDNDSRVGKMLRALADPAFARQYRADIADLHTSLHAAHPSRGVVDERRLIGWRTGDYLWETTDRAVALNWLGNVEVLPIFEGDPNTKLQAAALPAVPSVPEGLRVVGRVQRGPAPHDPLYALILPGVDDSTIPEGTPLYAPATPKDQPAHGVVDEDGLRAAYVEAHDAEESWLEGTGHLYDPGLPVDAGIRAVVRALQAAQPAVPSVPEADPLAAFFTKRKEDEAQAFIARAKHALREILVALEEDDYEESRRLILDALGESDDGTPKDQPAQGVDGAPNKRRNPMEWSHE